MGDLEASGMLVRDGGSTAGAGGAGRSLPAGSGVLEHFYLVISNVGGEMAIGYHLHYFGQKPVGM